MINSRGIRILCYFIMGFVMLLSVVLILFGISALNDEGKLGGIWIFLGLLLPFLTTVSLYPMFALANIDENIRELNDNLKELVFNQNELNNPPPSVDADACEDVPEEAKVETEVLYHLSDIEKTINFINLKYGISINLEEEFEEMREEVLQFENDSFSASILKSRVAEAKNKNELLKIFNDHRILYS